MAINNWIGGSGSQSWTNTANWSLAAAPVSTDDVVISQGNSDINSNLSHAAIILNSLTIGGSFTGTIGVPGVPSTPLAIGLGSGKVFNFNANAGVCIFDFGTTNYQGIIIQTGAATSTTVGSEAVRIRGGGSTATMAIGNSGAVFGSGPSVGIATEYAGLTATLATLSVSGGTVNTGTGITGTTCRHSGGTLYIGGGNWTLIQQATNQPILTLGGVATGNLVAATGQMFVNSRPATGDVLASPNIGPGATMDFSQDPRTCSITTAINISIGGILVAFSPSQVTAPSAAALPIQTIECGIQDIYLRMGANVVMTIQGY